MDRQHTRPARIQISPYLAVGLCLAMLLGASAAPSARAEEWKCYRSAEENHHCYALARWDMAGCPKECISGGVANIDTQSMDVPGWENGNFVDDEMWVSNSKYYGWIESGQTGGSPYGCCSVHRFYATARSEDGKEIYHEYVQPTSLAFNYYYDYVIQDLNQDGEWSVVWGTENTNWEVAAVYGRNWTQTDELEAGMEGGSNTQPTNNAIQALAGVWGSPPEWHPWGGAYSGVDFYKTPDEPVCIKQTSGSWPGNANYWTSC